MTTLSMARSAYGAVGGPARSDRAAEYDVIARITARMNSAITAEAPPFADLAAALHENGRLWTTLAADVAMPGNRLPEALRAQILYLAEFTLQHSRKVLSKQATAETLIEINTAIMRGLRGNGGQGA